MPRQWKKPGIQGRRFQLSGLRNLCPGCSGKVPLSCERMSAQVACGVVPWAFLASSLWDSVSSLFLCNAFPTHSGVINPRRTLSVHSVAMIYWLRAECSHRVTGTQTLPDNMQGSITQLSISTFTFTFSDFVFVLTSCFSWLSPALPSPLSLSLSLAPLLQHSLPRSLYNTADSYRISTSRP